MKKKTSLKWFIFSISIVCSLLLGYRYSVVENEHTDLRKRVENISEIQVELIQEELIKKERTLLKLEMYLIVFFVLNLVIISLFIIKRWRPYIDNRRKKREVNFHDLKSTRKKDMLSDIFCNTCAKPQNTIFLDERILLGEKYLIVKCQECGNEIKIKSS